MSVRRPPKYQKHVQRIKYLEWNREDGTTRVYEFDAKYKVRKIIDYDPYEEESEPTDVDFTHSEPDVSENSEEGLKISYPQISPRESKASYVIPQIKVPDREYKRQIIELPLGISHIFRSVNPCCISLQTIPA